MHYLREYSTRSTPQSEPMRSDQIANSAGGYAWSVDDWTQLRRFLILGAEGGTYYIGQRQLVRENAAAVERCIRADGPRTVTEIVEVSHEGRAPKNDPALFALAMAAKLGDDKTRRLALDVLPQVARVGTHLFHFAAYLEQFGGWGRGTRRAIGRWYSERDVEQLAYQIVKYRQRDGWSHRDLLRLAHPEAPTSVHAALYDLACEREFVSLALPLVEGYVAAQKAEKPRDTAKLVAEYGLPREALNTDHLNAPEVWMAMLEGGMPIGALIRNLATMQRVGVLTQMGEGVRLVVDALADGDRLRKARVHPIAILSALSIYGRGYSALGRGEGWDPNPQVVDALDAAFYEAFGGVTPANKRTMLALDVSGSMDWGDLAGVPGLTPRMGAGAMALVTAATEPQYAVVAFSTQLVPCALSPRERLDDVLAKLDAIPMGGTDCALPMVTAEAEGLEIDTFVIYTDSETWAGGIHPAQALQSYREKSGIAARLVVVGMEGNRFSIADPQDGGMLDVVGFDTAAPELISAFSRGEV